MDLENDVFDDFYERFSSMSFNPALRYKDPLALANCNVNRYPLGRPVLQQPPTVHSKPHPSQTTCCLRHCREPSQCPSESLSLKVISFRGRLLCLRGTHSVTLPLEMMSLLPGVSHSEFLSGPSPSPSPNGASLHSLSFYHTHGPCPKS